MKRIIKLSLFLTLIIFLIYSYARFIEPKLIAIKTSKITSQYISKELSNIKIVQFSDTHISDYFTIKDLMKTVKKINKLNPDIVLFTGDLIDNYSESTIDSKKISYVLSLIDATLGKYSVYGNHDYGGGATRIYKEIMNDAGFKLLINDSVYLKEYNLTITGLDDALFGNPDIDNITKFINKGAYNILLCHEPDIIDYIADYNFDLAISGHSHGEQVKIPFMDDIILPPLAKTYVKGMYELDSDREGKIYVNKGIGTSKIPFRFLAPPEITLFKFNISKDGL